MSESQVLNEMQERIKALVSAGKHNGQMVAALENFGYEIFVHPLFGKGVSAISEGEQVVCYHPKLEDKTADP